MPSPPRIPTATYRLQFNREFTFDNASRIVPYLARLGVSHVYSSPILKARPGSHHGYDVTDYTQLNPELGSREDFDRLVEVLHGNAMGLIVDVVPNHVGVMGNDNPWWLDLLENGPAARYGSYFDIDWYPNRASLHGRVLVPVLADPYGVALERGDLRLVFDAEAGSFSVCYGDHRMPIDPREYPRIFVQPMADEVLAADDPQRADFESLLDSFANLPARSDDTAPSVAMRYRDKESHKRRLVRLVERSRKIRSHVERSIARMNGRPGEPASFDALDVLLEAQAWRLSYWRVAMDEINYRRFFDVNDLAALRMDDPEVFDSTHALIFDLIRQGSIDGLRIDHSDGLYDPQSYFDRIHCRPLPSGQASKPLYVATEKILASHERLPRHWRVNGTTGYEFSALCTAWMVCGDNETAMTRRYRQFTGTRASFEQIVYESKRLVMRATLAAEIEVLATQLDRIAQMDRRTADFTRASMHEAIREVIACFPVYRTYISSRGVSDEDRRMVHWAINVARRRSAGSELSAFDFLRDVLLGEAAHGKSPSVARSMLEFTMKFQQTSAPVMAKGFEDTACYRFNRLACLNEVGSDPGRFSVSSSALHQANLERADLWPHSMLSTCSHDSKRSEDVRARIAVLSELPDLWQRHLSRWARLNRSRRRRSGEGPAPSREDEYLFYQTLLGVWPPGQDLSQPLPPRFVERLQAYVVKAAREAKRSTSWLDPNEEYETALCAFVAQLLARPARNAFLRDFASFAATVAFFGNINSLAQVALKLTSPGLPDLYQGTELPTLTLVDPDNRHPVDFAAAAARLAVIAPLARLSPAMLAQADGASAKLHLTSKLLQLRRRDPDLFALGGYQPLRIDGAAQAHACAFARTHAGRCLMVVVPRWSAKLMHGVNELPLAQGVWGDTRVLADTACEAPMRNVLTDRPVRARMCGATAAWRAADLLQEFPVAVLYGTPSRQDAAPRESGSEPG